MHSIYIFVSVWDEYMYEINIFDYLLLTNIMYYQVAYMCEMNLFRSYSQYITYLIYWSSNYLSWTNSIACIIKSYICMRWICSSCIPTNIFIECMTWTCSSCALYIAEIFHNVLDDVQTSTKFMIYHSAILSHLDWSTNQGVLYWIFICLIYTRDKYRLKPHACDFSQIWPKIMLLYDNVII